MVDEARNRGDSPLIEASDLPAGIRGSLGSAYVPPPIPPTVLPLDDLLTQVERRLIEHALTRSRHNKSKAAELLGISRPRLYRRIRELGLPDEPEGSEELTAASTALAPVLTPGVESPNHGPTES
ncbi:MAG: helix-turn-helix domain-containing protein [Isosphaeraceae bacterium]